MRSLLDQDTEGSGDECDEKIQDPKCVDSGGNSRCLERWDIEDRDGRVDEVSVDGEMGRLVDELHEKNIGEIFRLLL